jgi:hypothetical protein
MATGWCRLTNYSGILEGLTPGGLSVNVALGFGTSKAQVCTPKRTLTFARRHELIWM